jgi:hypothetical protein
MVWFDRTSFRATIQKAEGASGLIFSVYNAGSLATFAAIRRASHGNYGDIIQLSAR